MRPLQAVSPGTRVVLGIAFFVLFFAVWAFATLGGYVSKTFLADPITMVRSGLDLLLNQGFAADIGMTVWRVLGGFVIAALLAVPLGVLMGAYKPVEAFFEPFVSFARYLPASAFIPLLILWAGIGETQKLAVIFIGSFFQLVLMIAVSVGNTRRDLVEAARVDGATGLQLVFAGSAGANGFGLPATPLALRQVLDGVDPADVAAPDEGGQSCDGAADCCHDVVSEVVAQLHDFPFQISG